MPIRYTRRIVYFEGRCAVEEALGLVDQLRRHPRVPLSLAKCTDMHTALLQVLLAFRPRITASPADPLLAALLPAGAELISPQPQESL